MQSLRRPAVKVSPRPALTHASQQHASQPGVPPRSKGSLKGIALEVICQCDQAITILDRQAESESESLNIATTVSTSLVASHYMNEMQQGAHS